MSLLGLRCLKAGAYDIGKLNTNRELRSEFEIEIWLVSNI